MTWNKREMLKAQARRMVGCQACPLSSTRKNIVFGSGNLSADLLIIGEGPGANEDLIGEAFVGPSGDMLNKILHESGFERSDFFITNVVRCRAADPLGNDRRPVKPEIHACSSWLAETIYIVDPIAIVAAGKVAMSVFTKLKTVREGTKEMVDVRLNGKHTGLSYPMMVIHHPADLLRRAHNYDIYQTTIDQLRHLKRTVDAFRSLSADKKYLPTSRVG